MTVITAQEARDLAYKKRVSDLDGVYTNIRASAMEGNSSLVVEGDLNFDEKATLQEKGFEVTRLGNNTLVSWAQTPPTP